MILGHHTIDVLKRPEPTLDAYNNPTYNWATAVSTSVPGCSVQPVDGDEQTVGRDTVVFRWRTWAPDGTDVDAVDRVVFDGDTYEVDGPAQRWDYPPLSHVTFLMRRS